MILVTGGSGFIGSQIEGDVKLSSKDIDLRDFNKTLELFESINPDKIIHCAGVFGNYLNQQNQNVKLFRDNMLIDMNVLEASRMIGVKKLIALSSTSVFPYKLDKAYTEDDLHCGEAHYLTYGYSYSKRMTNVLVKAYKEQYGLNYLCAIISNIYGPKDSFNLSRATVIPTLIKRCYDAKINNSDFVVDGDGSPARDFIFVDDVRYLIEWFKNNDTKYSSIIFSSGTETSIKEVVNIIVECLNFTGKIVWNNKNKNLGQNKKTANNSRLLSVIKDMKFTDLKTGIKKTIDWFYNEKI